MTLSNEFGLFKRILFCTDFSENADFAFDYAVKQMRCHEAELFLLHVIPEPDAQFWKTYLYEVDDVDNKARTDIDEKVEAAYVSKLPEGMTMALEYRVGTDYAEILKYAEEINADLLVIGRQGRSKMGKILFGNVTERVVRKANCAVMVVPLSFEEKMIHP